MARRAMMTLYYNPERPETEDLHTVLLLVQTAHPELELDWDDEEPIPCDECGSDGYESIVKEPISGDWLCDICVKGDRG